MSQIEEEKPPYRLGFYSTMSGPSYSSYVADYADAPTGSRDSEISGCNPVN